ncbi:MAG TPA: DUF937 domain-containing protein, partial [Thermoanaerobaculia bacterium]|nr:DUF937 domain-containing protein [Thermoanaerobaculia bacterium]
LSQMSRQLGISEDQTREALPAALAALTGGLAQNAAQPQGAQQLSNALNKDHDGGLLDSLDGFLGGGGGGLGAGAAILGHVFGQRKQQVEGNLGRATGLNPQTMASLLAMLAPIVMAYLGRQQRQKQLDPGGLAEVLGQQRQRIEQVPQARTGLGALLDRDGDGSVIDDLTDLAGGLFGKR